MTMPEIINPLAGYQIGYTWEQHQTHRPKLIGGEDYRVGAGVKLMAAATGRAYASGGSVTIYLADGRAVSLREMRSYIGSFPRNVVQGEPVAVTGRIVDGEIKWPHIDATVGGIRTRFTSLLGGTSGGTTAPITPEVDMDDNQALLLREIHAALGAGGANISTVPASRTVLGLTRDIHGALGAAGAGSQMAGTLPSEATILGLVRTLPGSIDALISDEAVQTGVAALGVKIDAIEIPSTGGGSIEVDALAAALLTRIGPALVKDLVDHLQVQVQLSAQDQ